MGQWDLCWCTVRGLSKIKKTHMLHAYYQYQVQRSERVGTRLLGTGILSILRPAKEDNIFNFTSGAHRRITRNRRARSQFVHTMSTLLRNRSPGKDLPRHFVIVTMIMIIHAPTRGKIHGDTIHISSKHRQLHFFSLVYTKCCFQIMKKFPGVLPTIPIVMWSTWIQSILYPQFL